jgi:subtilisin family serine protease
MTTLKAPVVNLSSGGTVSSRGVAGIYDAAVRSSRRNDILQREDPLPIDVTQLVMGNASNENRTLFVVAAGNEGGDLRRPEASMTVLRLRAAAAATKALLEDLPGASAADIKKVQELASKDAKLGMFPCRPKGMGVTQRPLGTPKQQTKGGALSMLRMPDGTFDRGNILCVAASDWNGHLTAFSNWGPGIVDVAAPGAHIVGTGVGDGYRTANGTSYSAPMVAAVAAMVYSVVPDAQPWLVKCAILSSATSKPLRVDPTRLPYQDLTVSDVDNFGIARETIPYPNGNPLTVMGIVQAPEAISAALHLDARVKRKLAGGWGSWPTCVQKRGIFGGWKNTPTLSVR